MTRSAPAAVVVHRRPDPSRRTRRPPARMGSDQTRLELEVILNAGLETAIGATVRSGRVASTCAAAPAKARPRRSGLGATRARGAQSALHARKCTSQLLE